MRLCMRLCMQGHVEWYSPLAPDAALVDGGHYYADCFSEYGSLSRMDVSLLSAPLTLPRCL